LTFRVGAKERVAILSVWKLVAVSQCIRFATKQTVLPMGSAAKSIAKYIVGAYSADILADLMYVSVETINVPDGTTKGH
jgi:hypothetical protein